MVEEDQAGKWHARAGRLVIAVLLSAVSTILPIARRANAFEVLVTAPLAVSDVENIISAAVTRAARDKVDVVVAVSDREGNNLGVWDMPGAPTGSKDVDVINE